MTLRVALQHNTHYKFDRQVNVSAHTIRLRPAPHTRTRIHSYSLNITPQDHFINWQQDAFGNYLARVVFPEKTDKLSIEVEVIADMTVINPFDFFLEEYAESYPFKYTKQLKKELAPYLEKTGGGDLFKKLLKHAKKLPLRYTRTIDFLVAINMLVHKKVDYCIRLEHGVQTPEETLEKKSGSCRDSAWLLAQLLRECGLASRFASGYLVQLTSDEKCLDGPSGPEQDFTDLHAWCEVFIPGAGWVGLDPTSGLFASEGHIPLACTPDPVSAAPIEGATDKCEVDFDYSNDVTRILEDPRVTKPYNDDQWASIIRLGDDIERQLTSEDVRLTMGGEPTFVSIDDMESAQWNTEALGKDKLKLGKQLLNKLRDHFAPNGLLHYGQGKWYPGEEVPRWALGLFWRKDKQPLWKNPALLADPDKAYDYNHSHAESLMQHLADTLGIPENFIQPAYEDVLHYLSEEQRLPFYTDLKEAAKNGEDLGHKRLQQLLERGLDKPTGLVLPIEYQSHTNRWASSQWQFRKGALVLSPGDSPMGLRLPLNEIHSDNAVIDDRDPMEPRDALEPRDKMDMIRYPVFNDTAQKQFIAEQAANARKKKSTKTNSDKTKASTESDANATPNWIRTALCIEVRNSRIYIFMPPTRSLESYLLLLCAIEECVGSLALEVIIEGYEPPHDHRLQKLLVTPDPGVIEVNVHPSSSWRELIQNTQSLYQLAKENRLGAEKFMLDGRHTGTGGGNHITLGGKTPADSPFLRKPDLLRSFITFWQHHPSLSYLFSGTFIGPTSQAPRVDEGRDEMLYELEIAFQQMPEGLPEQPWLIDRLLRNLLIDITGNTHRAEFCIDKLYAPGSASGRLGILEFRGFEMPPHYQMSLVQALFIRTLLMRFWKTPYKHPLVRWGTSLHDKFMLPHFVWQDIKEICADLNSHGFDFKPEWLLPFEEFRFPHYGRVKLDDIELELRWAIEPWHVLGEEVSSFGTARYVDSSVERLQVRVSGLTDNRYVLSCNGRRVPLKNTGVQGEFVAGVRYRAWAPPSALHPTIGTHTPLTFDLIDTWNGRSIGGCSYHVSHPGGRNYDTFPVNAFEAEARRVNRFGNLQHQQGPYTPQPEVDALREFFPHINEHNQPRPMAPPPEEPMAEYPFTLDLRKLP